MAHAHENALAWALSAFRDRDVTDRYALYADYVDGKHDVAFVSTAYRNAFRDLLQSRGLNYCRRVVATHAARLRVVGFSDDHEGDGAASGATTTGGADGSASREIGIRASDDPTARAWALWRANRMAAAAGEVHREMLTAADAYVIVEKHPETGEVCLWPQRAGDVRVHYDDERPGEITVAAKKWRLHDGRARLNLYFPDRIETYVSRHKEAVAGAVRPEAFERFVDADGAWPRYPGAPGIPVFHFANGGRTGELGTSILADVVPIQDKINKAVHDMMVAGEYGAFRQRWVVGVSPLTDPTTGLPVVGVDGMPISPFRSGPGEVWTIGPGEAGQTPARFGDFAETNIGQYIDQKKDLRVDLGIISGTPLRYLTPDSGTAPSGEALKTEDAPLIAATEDRQAAAGQVWADVVRYGLALLDGTEAPGLAVEWAPAGPRSERESAELGMLYLQSGWPEEEVWRFQGKTEDEVRRMRDEKDRQGAVEAAWRETAEVAALQRFGDGGNAAAETGEEG